MCLCKGRETKRELTTKGEKWLKDISSHNNYCSVCLPVWSRLEATVVVLCCFAALLLCCCVNTTELTQKLLLRNWTSFLHSFFSQCQPQEKKVLSVSPKTWGLIGWSLLLSVLWLVGVLVHAWGMHTRHVGVFGRNFVFLMAPGQDGGDFLLPAAWSAFSFDILVGFCQTYF